jgi:23S rRNA pseudouridine1911/1915/1917 synthase
MARKEPPVEGDDQVLLSRQALHAHRIQFKHPLTDEPLQLEAPLPADMQSVLDALSQ